MFSPTVVTLTHSALMSLFQRIPDRERFREHHWSGGIIRSFEGLNPSLHCPLVTASLPLPPTSQDYKLSRGSTKRRCLSARCHSGVGTQRRSLLVWIRRRCA